MPGPSPGDLECQIKRWESCTSEFPLLATMSMVDPRKPCSLSLHFRLEGSSSSKLPPSPLEELSLAPLEFHPF